jgi:chromosome segregation ATPase
MMGPAVTVRDFRGLDLALQRTVMMATPAPAGAAVPRSRVHWIGESIAYIYVYLRGKLHAGERRRRLMEERAGAETLLGGAVKELGQLVLRDGVQHPEVTGLLEAIGRAHARRESAVSDAATSEALQQAEETRLHAQQRAAEENWARADRASREFEEIVRSATADRRTAETRLARIKDERARVAREAGGGAAIGEGRQAQLAHDAAGLIAEQRPVEEQVTRLDRQLADLRSKAGALRDDAASAKAKLDEAVVARRQAASAMAASIAGRMRDRAEAEREVAELTEQLGRVAADVRPPHAALLSSYQNIDRLRETIADRSAQLAALVQAKSHYDHRKLLTGVGLLTSMLIATGALLWAVLK